MAYYWEASWTSDKLFFRSTSTELISDYSPGKNTTLGSYLYTNSNPTPVVAEICMFWDLSPYVYIVTFKSLKCGRL